MSRRNQAILTLCLGLVFGNHSGLYSQRSNSDSSQKRNEIVRQSVSESRQVLRNVNFGVHAMFLNPQFMDSELHGSLQFRDLLDLGGFVGIIPRTWGHGGSHYGEFKAALRLFARDGFSIGPGVKRITISNTLDFTKYGLSGKARLGGAIFDWELMPYSTAGAGGASTWYSIPLPGPWQIDGFWNYLIDGKAVGKVNLKYPLPHKFDIMVEYFHNGFLQGADQDRVGIGIAYRIK